MNIFQNIKDRLDKENISYKILNHEHIHTSEQAAKVRGHDNLKRGAKAMIIRSEGIFYQFVLPGDKKIDFKKVKKVLNTDSASLAKPEEVEKVIGCAIGAVPPCGTFFGIKTYVDKTLLENEEFDFSAGKHTVTITMNTKDWMDLVKPEVVDFVR